MLSQHRPSLIPCILLAILHVACVAPDDPEPEIGSTAQADTVVASPLPDEAVIQLVATGHVLHEVRIRVTNQGGLRPFTCRLTNEQWKIPTYVWNPTDGFFPGRDGWYTLGSSNQATSNPDDAVIEWRFPIATALWFPMVNHFRFTIDCQDAAGTWVNAGSWSLDVPPANTDSLFPFDVAVNLPPAGPGNAVLPVGRLKILPALDATEPVVVPIAPPAIPAGHCSCNVTCTGNFFDTWVDVYGMTPAQCSHADPNMQAAEAATCPNWGVGTRRACNWVN